MISDNTGMTMHVNNPQDAAKQFAINLVVINNFSF